MTTKVKKPSLIQQRKEQTEKLQEQVIDLLGWSELAYCEFQYHSGIEFIEAYIGKDSPYGMVLERSRVFWNWWKNQWTLRNEQFVREVGKIGKRFDVDYWYKTMNSGSSLASYHHPHRRVIDDSYCQMITEFVNEEKSKQHG